MKTAFPIIIALILALMSPISSGQEPVRTEKSQASPKLVVLKNGHILEGRLTKEIDNYSLKTTQGSRLVLPASDIDFVCQTLSEAYWQRNARIKASDLDGHKELYYWCLKYQLLNEAQNQIDILSLMPIKASELEYIHRQLTIAIEQSNPKSEQVEVKTPPTQLATNSPLPANPETKVPFFRSLPPLQGPAIVDSEKFRRLPQSQPLIPPSLDETGRIAQVGFSAPVRESQSVKPTKKTDINQPDIAELENLTKSLPKPSVAMFQRKVQPLVVRSCMATGCHGRADNVMPLMGAKSGQLIPRRLSQRNMHSIIQHADPNEPLESALLKFALKPHGGMKRPTILPGTPQFEILATWLIQISNHPNAVYQLPAPPRCRRPRFKHRNRGTILGNQQ